VHILGVTDYESGNGNTMRSFESRFKEQYERFTPYFEKFPWGIGEFGCGSGGEVRHIWGQGWVTTEHHRNKHLQAEWVRDMFQALNNKQEPVNRFARNFKYIVWFSSNDNAYLGPSQGFPEPARNYVVNQYKLVPAQTETWVEFRIGLANCAHVWKDNDCTKGCTLCGLIESHNWSLTDWEKDETHHWRTCRRFGCEARYQEAAHEWGAWVPIADEGLETRTCNVCKLSITRQIPEVSVTIDGGSITPAFTLAVRNYEVRLNCGAKTFTIQFDNGEYADISLSAGVSAGSVVHKVEILELDYELTFKVFTPFDNTLLHSTFPTTIEVINNASINGGFTFTNTGYTWFIDGEEQSRISGGVLNVPSGVSGKSFSVWVTLAATRERHYVCPYEAVKTLGKTIRVFPNPAREYIIVEKQTEENAVIEIFSLRGELLRTFLSTGEHTKVDLISLPEGSYTVRAGDESAVFIISR
jgi:membrane-bound inhibitor of C-type lysozyme